MVGHLHFRAGYTRQAVNSISTIQGVNLTRPARWINSDEKADKQIKRVDLWLVDFASNAGPGKERKAIREA